MESKGKQTKESKEIKLKGKGGKRQQRKGTQCKGKEIKGNEKKGKESIRRKKGRKVK